MISTQQKCGFIAMLGRPNAGKSTLVNALVGQKVAAVSRLRQTTRHSIRGIYTADQDQCIFVDTPGLHQSHKSKPMNNLMRQIAEQVADEVDIVVYLIDGAHGWHDDDTRFLQQLKAKNLTPTILVTKADKVKKFVLAEHIATIEEHCESIFDDDETEIFVCSAKRPESVTEIRNLFKSRLPVGPWLYEEDLLSHQSEKFLLAEMIQEQLFRQLKKELPYQCRVIVDRVEHQPHICNIHATIIASQNSQKSIILGKGGAQIKSLGQKSRETLEKNLDKKVFLSLQVTVQKDWERRRDILSDYLNSE